MITLKTQRKLRGLWKSKTHWAAVIISSVVSAQPLLSKWLEYKLTPENFALSGLIIYFVFNALRWITEQPLEDKGKQ